MSRKLTILHFNVVEKYPPALNFISDALAQKSFHKISVITSLNNSPYKNRSFSGVKILPLGSTSKNSVLRYTSYLAYNFIGSLVLLLKRPDVVLVYETLSIFPAFIYSFVFPRKKIHIHFHEYISIPEKNVASSYMKFLFKCEAKLLRKYTCSQTNEDRKELFLMDNRSLKKQNVFVFPNLPPKSWWKDFGQYKKPWDGSIIKLVYVGVLDAETMYLEEVLKWVTNHPNEFELTLFSQDVSLSATKLLSKFQSDNIFLQSALEYNLLPEELIKHDIGLVLYKGHIPNYVYNVPNKVFEYLDCGLSVLADAVNKSLVQLQNPKVYQVSFQTLNQVNLKKLIQSCQQSENKRMIESTNSLISILIEK
jgi:hypothetical protein